ncbi:putative copper chaperone for respiratory chain complex IV [Protomyces lactucae-debilis]|uniref:Putative copper chaperone for respiratory chain complex IV n=1 Tax=Protomyces lactucae-debilis TaxID=2754530 RepID=A0A1Y2FI56_PROLT|nr:putative copper chaperone for respiratory chain complex IV [Protomyces lactucae-debilis]ORY83630.1 putative copper chaperone for respiratory chain complex IV [Protomyces lactucae-debilis]
MAEKIGERTPKLAADGRPKPCCICLDEKRVRDECMFNSEDGMVQCKDLIQKHRECMAGFGYKV